MPLCLSQGGKQQAAIWNSIFTQFIAAALLTFVSLSLSLSIFTIYHFVPFMPRSCCSHIEGKFNALTWNVSLCTPSATSVCSKNQLQTITLHVCSRRLILKVSVELYWQCQLCIDENELQFASKCHSFSYYEFACCIHNVILFSLTSH